MAGLQLCEMNPASPAQSEEDVIIITDDEDNTLPVGAYKVSETRPVGDTPLSSGRTQGADHRTQIVRKRGQDLTSKRADPDPCQGHPSGYDRVTECPPTKRPRLYNVQKPIVKEGGRKHTENPHEDKLSASKKRAKANRRKSKGKAKDTHKTTKGNVKDTHITSKGKAKDTHKTTKGKPDMKPKTLKGKAKDTHKTSKGKAKDTHITLKGKVKDTHITLKGKAKDTHKTSKGKPTLKRKTPKGKPEDSHKTSMGKAKDTRKTSKGKPNLKRNTLDGKAKDKHKLQESSLSTSKGKANGNTKLQEAGSSRSVETSCASVMMNTATEHSNDTTPHGHSVSAPRHQPAANPDSQHDVGQIAFTKLYSTCSGLLTGESAKLLVLIKNRYYRCSDACRSSAAMVELLEITMVKMQSDQKKLFVHIKDCLSKLKAWGAKNNLMKQGAAENPLFAVAGMSRIEDSTSEGSGMEGTLQGTLGSGSAPPLPWSSTASPSYRISPRQSEAASSQQSQSDLHRSTGPLHKDQTKGPVCESVAAEHVARRSPSASREVVTSSGDTQTLLHQGATRSSSITMSTQSKLEVNAASRMGTNLRVSEEQDVGQEKATASTDASSPEHAETQEVRTTPHEPAEEKLDPDQQAVMERWEDEMMIVNAGPGSGKTFTLCKLIERIRQERPESRVLVLDYNRYAVSELRARLMNYGVLLLEDNDTAYRSTDEGCFISTFHSFAQQSSDSGKVFKKDKKDFDITFKENVESLKRKARDNPALTWDWVIVDEGQDVTAILAELVDTLRLTCRHFVVAGDPRQAIREGATWFSDLWRLPDMEPHKAKLRFNHRSGPEMVNFLNDYSRKNFESYDLNYDQISLRKKQATVEMATKVKSNMGEIIGRRLMLSPPDKAYALTPASLEKWTNGQVTQSIAKTLSAQGSELQKIENLNDGRVPATDVYTAGTVFSLKGTERSRMVVYGVSRSYQPTIKDEVLHRLIFVAISRARDHLHIILDKKLPDKSPLKPFEEKKTETRPQKYSKLNVTDLAGENYRWWVVKEPLSRPCLDRDRVPKQGVNIGSHGDPGFVGLYVESVIAYVLGCNISDAKVNDLLSQVSNLNDEVKGLKKNKPKGGFISQLHKNFLDVQKVNPCFAFAQARRSLQDGKIYEDKDQITGQWERHQEVCQPFTDFLHSHIQCPQYQEYLCLAITPDRSSKEVGHLVGIADFVGKTSVVEIKHVSEIRREHRVQTAMYAAMSLQCKEALLVNLKDADIKTVTAVDPVELVHFARAKLALKNCQGRKRIRQSGNDCFIAVSTVRNESKLVGEIGAVAFSLAGEILGTYHRIMPGVEEASEGHRLPRDSRFSLVFQQARLLVGNADIFKKHQEKVSEGFQQWFQFMRDDGAQCRFVFWDEEDAKILKLRELSHNPVHLPSLLSVGSSRDSELSLRGWVEKSLGDDWPYEAHRAFEDAVAVAALKLLL